ncbi:MAG TPA: hypothetical protein VHM70_31345 [Polyangiaceae bacterium]|jgi:hypothetical protein|nr:hypothetical protein [Polyangiaceae bacterium]
MTKRSKALFALLSLTLSLSSSLAWAQTPRDDADTFYRFDDDDLLAQAFGADGDVVRVRLGPARTLLIRPRTQFVAELLKSVERL